MNEQRQIVVEDERGMHDFADNFVKELDPKSEINDLKSASITGLNGDLGAGKTTFVKGVAKALGVGEIVNSPTFVIMKIYKLVDQTWNHLVHIDAYRLSGGQELLSLGWQEQVSDPKNIIFVEWADKVKDIIPKHSTILNFEVKTGGKREIKYLWRKK